MQAQRIAALVEMVEQQRRALNWSESHLATVSGVDVRMWDELNPPTMEDLATLSDILWPGHCYELMDDPPAGSKSRRFSDADNDEVFRRR